MVKKFEREAPRPFDRLIVEVLPNLPDLSGRPDALLERLEVAHAKLEVGSEQRGALVELAYLYHANGFATQAESCYLGLESLEVENPRWPYLLGCLKTERADKAEVARHFVRSLELDPNNSMAYLRLGSAYREAGLIEEARTVYGYRLLSSPEDGWARAYLGMLSIMEQNWEAARDRLEEARASSQHVSLVYDYLPDVYLELGDFEKARAVREEGDSLTLLDEPWDESLAFMVNYCFDPQRLFRLAKVERVRKQFDTALELLEKAVELDGGYLEAVAELQALVTEIKRQERTQ